MSNIKRILSYFKNVKNEGNNQFKVECPAHPDSNPSLSINEKNNKVLLYCHAGCTYDAIIKAANIKKTDIGYTTAKTLRHCDIGCDIEGYATSKGIPVKFLKKKFKAKNGKYKGNQCVLLPYLNAKNKKVRTRKRIALSGKDQYRWNKGKELCLYCIWLLTNCIKKFVFLVEGESDCHTLWYKGYPALGVPGANSWDDDRDAQHFKKFKTVYFVYEPDKGGDTLLKSLEQSSIADKIMVIHLGKHKDVSDLYLASRTRFNTRLKKAMDKAVPIAEFSDTLKEIKKAGLFDSCKNIAKNKNILNLFYKDLQRCGVVGEEKYVKIVYLCLVTRFFKHLVSILVRGASSSGKSFTIQKILEHFFPESACYAMTSMSPKALIYMEEELKNRFIWIFESSGISNKELEYVLRSLLSEGCIKYKVAEKNSEGQFITRNIDKEGPTGLIVTTTKIKYNEENENRCITINTDDSKEQSKTVLMSIATGQDVDFDGSKWLAYQEWLSMADHKVNVPYAGAIVALMDVKATRIRRDFTKIISLVKAHAMMHQLNRERNSNGEIIATLRDYSVIRLLINNSLSDSIEKTIPAKVRETVNMVEQIILEGNRSTTTAQLVERIKVHRSTANRRVNEALSLGYLRNDEVNPNRPKILLIGEDMPKNRKLLPPVGKLKVHIKKLK